MILEEFVPRARLLLNTLDRLLFPFPRTRTNRASKRSKTIRTTRSISPMTVTVDMSEFLACKYRRQ